MGKRPGGGEGFIGKHYKTVPDSKESTTSVSAGGRVQSSGRERKASKEEGKNLGKADILQYFYLLQFYF